MSVEELDATVRAFYEGRGDTVRTSRLIHLSAIQLTSLAAKASSGDP